MSHWVLRCASSQCFVQDSPRIILVFGHVEMDSNKRLNLSSSTVQDPMSFLEQFRVPPGDCDRSGEKTEPAFRRDFDSV